MLPYNNQFWMIVPSHRVIDVISDSTIKITSSMENQQQPMSFHNVPSQSAPPSIPLFDTQRQTMPVVQSSQEEVFENNQIQFEEEGSITHESGAQCDIPKSQKQENKNLQYARLYHLMTPKSAFLLFDELFPGVKIKVQNHPENHLNSESYTATVEIHGETFVANSTSMVVARENACEQVFRNLLVKQISYLSEKKGNFLKGLKMKDGENSTPSVSSLQEFPWHQYAKLAMHKLLNVWGIPDASIFFNAQNEYHYLHGIKRFPKDPTNYNPVQLLYVMRPDVQFKNANFSNYGEPIHQVSCEIDGVSFVAQGSSKKDAKKECCIKAIKYFWNYDF